MSKTLKTFFRYWPVALTAMVCLVLETLCDLKQPSLLAQLINEGAVRGDTAAVFGYARQMLAFTGLGMLFAISRSVLSSHVSQRFGRDMRLKLYQTIQHLPLPEIDQFERASLITRMTNDVTQTQSFLHGMMRVFLRAPVMSVGSVIMAVRLSPHMAQSLAVVVPAAGAIIALSIVIGYPYFYQVQRSIDRMNQTLREYLSGVRVVKAFNRFAFEQDRFEDSNQALTGASLSAMRITAVFSPAVQLVVNLGIAAVILIGGSAGEETGTVVAFIEFMSRILMSLSMFSNIFNQMVRALVSIKRLDAVLDAPDGAEAVGGPAGSDVPGRAQTLAFESVTFQYQGAKGPVLQDISFTARRGELIGIIGATGTGKTTLIQLIPRLYDVTAGRILLNGADVRTFERTALRDRIALAPQQSALFTGTIAENLRWGKDSASEPELWAALETAQAAAFVRGFPESLNTWLGQGGVNLSGGQKQRLMIARALVKKPDVLLLDDCLSAVDVTTESKIRHRLQAMAGAMITLVVSQRLTSIMACDRILVLDEGRIIGEGTHAELMHACSIYRDIYQSQVGMEAEAHVG